MNASAHDLTACLAELGAGAAQTAELWRRSQAAARADACAFAFLTLQEIQQFEAGPLHGVAVSVKDLFDVAGEITRSGTDPAQRVIARTAHQDSVAVARLRAAGAAFIGRTNMTELAFSGMGLNPHHGHPKNPADPLRISGGSTSGGAVSVATGAAWAALGSDTGGSLRIPAAWCGVVGFKPTARRVPTDGAVPLSTTLDSVGAITLSAHDAALLDAVLSGQTPAARQNECAPVADIEKRPLRLAVPETLFLDALDVPTRTAFEAALAALEAAGERVERVALAQVARSAWVQERGGFSSQECLAMLRDLRVWPQKRSSLDPRVERRIAAAQTMTDADYAQLCTRRAAWQQDMALAMAGFDAFLSPTVPIVAPLLAEVLTDDDAFFAANAQALRNTSLVNLLDGCAISVPCHRPRELPVGLMLWHGPMHDAQILHAASRVERTLSAAGRGKIGHGASACS